MESLLTKFAFLVTLSYLILIKVATEGINCFFSDPMLWFRLHLLADLNRIQYSLKRSLLPNHKHCVQIRVKILQLFRNDFELELA